MTATNFNAQEYLGSLGRLDARAPLRGRQTLTLKPGKPTMDGNVREDSAFDSVARVMYPEALLYPIFPDDMPKDAYPLVIGPAFKWVRPNVAWEKVDAIRRSEIVYDERGSDLDLGDLMWSRMHAAYLLNEIVPDQQITLHLRTTDADSIHDPSNELADRKPTDRSPPRRALRRPSPAVQYAYADDAVDREADTTDLLRTLIETDDDLDTSPEEFRSFSFADPEPGTGRRVSSRTWHEEMLPLAKQHFTFMTNSRIFVGSLASRFCTPPTDIDAILKLFKPAVARSLSGEMKVGLSSWNIGHAVVLQNLFAFADSTPAQRMALFSDLVSAEKPDDIRPSLGTTLVAGRYFGSRPCRMRTLDRAASHFGLLIGAGILAVDTANSTLVLTEGGRKYVEMIGPPFHIMEYQRGMVDQLGQHVPPLVIGPTAEAWLMEYFETLKVKLAALDRPDER